MSLSEPAEAAAAKTVAQVNEGLENTMITTMLILPKDGTAWAQRYTNSRAHHATLTYRQPNRSIHMGKHVVGPLKLR